MPDKPKRKVQERIPPSNKLAIAAVIVLAIIVLLGIFLAVNIV